MFKSWVRERRGNHLTPDESKIFDGGYMTGERALSLGLIDGLADIDMLVKQLGGEKAKPVWLRPKPPRGIMRFITRSAVESAIDIAEERLFAPALR